jgi:hypothetical protein
MLYCTTARSLRLMSMICIFRSEPQNSQMSRERDEQLHTSAGSSFIREIKYLSEGIVRINGNISPVSESAIWKMLHPSVQIKHWGSAIRPCHDVQCRIAPRDSWLPSLPIEYEDYTYRRLPDSSCCHSWQFQPLPPRLRGFISFPRIHGHEQVMDMWTLS